MSSSNINKKPSVGHAPLKQAAVNQKTPTQKPQRIVSTATITKKSSTNFSSPLQNANSSIDKEVYLTPISHYKEKENCSPAASKDIFENLQMTPLSACAKLSDNRLYVDYLASLPTPTYKSNAEGNLEPKSGLCPRKLTVEASPDSSPRLPINKTFNVKGRNVPHVTVNNELLDVIEEEEGKSIHQSNNSPSLCRSKRDINLVGTPLRKYSESMRDLSTHKVGFFLHHINLIF